MTLAFRRRVVTPLQLKPWSLSGPAHGECCAAEMWTQAKLKTGVTETAAETKGTENYDEILCILSCSLLLFRISVVNMLGSRTYTPTSFGSQAACAASPFLRCSTLMNKTGLISLSHGVLCTCLQ